MIILDLKNCPFCNSKASIHESIYEGKKVFFIDCENGCANTSASEDLQSVIDDWNKRSNLIKENDDGLLSCPFCGGNACINEFDCEGKTFLSVICEDCQIISQASDNEQDIKFIWNSRLGQWT